MSHSSDVGKATNAARVHVESLAQYQPFPDELSDSKLKTTHSNSGLGMSVTTRNDQPEGAVG
jgi:hypothetical protein